MQKLNLQAEVKKLTSEIIITIYQINFTFQLVKTNTMMLIKEIWLS